MNRRTINVKDYVYQELKHNIMNLNLKPGQTMSTQEIATKLNVSRTPVREAFLKLQEESLVEMYPQRETIVSKIDLKRAEQELFVRKCLELGVIDQFLDKLTDSDIRKLEEEASLQKRFCEEKNHIEMLESDFRFHRVLFERGNQMVAWNAINNLSGHYNRFRVLTIQNEETMEGTVEQHLRIIGLFRNGEKEAAKAELLDHVSKMKFEKTGLIVQYPDYFITSGEDEPHHVGRLLGEGI